MGKQNAKVDGRYGVIQFFIKLVVFCLFILLTFGFVFGVHFNKGESMFPKVRDGDILIYYRLINDFEIGDVIAYEQQDQTVIGRVVAMGNDTIELSQEGQLLVNGNIQQEEIFFPTEKMPGGVSYPYKVNEESYFILCDNREHSSDSRFIGSVSKSKIKGKVINLFRRRGI